MRPPPQGTGVTPADLDAICAATLLELAQQPTPEELAKKEAEKEGKKEGEAEGKKEGEAAVSVLTPLHALLRTRIKLADAFLGHHFGGVTVSYTGVEAGKVEATVKATKLGEASVVTGGWGGTGEVGQVRWLGRVVFQVGGRVVFQGGGGGHIMVV